MKKILIVFCLLVFCGSCFAAEWHKFGKDGALLDTKSFIFSKDGFDFWMKSDADKYKTILLNQKVKYTLSHIYIICSSRKSLVKEMYFYNANDGLITADDGDDAEYSPIVPDSRFEFLYNRYCKIN